MPKPKHQPLEVVDALLARILGDTLGDDTQLRALHETLAGALALPIDVHVVGEPLSLVAVVYGGHPRRGLTARCHRDDGTEHEVSLADVVLPTTSAGAPYIEAYRTWLGIELRITGPTSPPTKRRRHKVSEDDLDLSKPIELVVLRVTQRAARCRLLVSERRVTLRTRGLPRVVPGQIAVIRPNRLWRRAGHPYLSGEVVSTRIDTAALGLVPLELHAFGVWDPAHEYWGEPDEDDVVPVEDWAKPIIARGPRPMFEMEQVLPGSDPEDYDTDPILEASDLRRGGDAAGAREILAGMLEADLRCLDAHAHLGNLLFDSSPGWALLHYEIGVRIGELSLGDGFDGVLAWGLVDNRPFLRCMQGLGLCLWRLRRWEEAERVLERMLWLNPSDNQGIRLILPEVQARETWVED
ncbi:tetratricopeptide repeat protein [Paraliomyxa miuraensis]|uniref:hypothetical protein n=1 Tax=Paraliomyxa miuraensis TaxID=376150 RepID=UPI0022569835|nr:hypothetical protein [Paraliomyxa miuraensis]MCX4247124.1 hypothetical protein [Paraliomyxa miuraensis]